MQTIDMLQNRFALTDELMFESDQNGLIFARIRNAFAEAVLSVQGAHVMTFQPHGQAPVLWMSKQSNFQPGKPIRGGIPICWPWFGAHPTDATKPAHGFARNRVWTVTETRRLSDGATRLRLILQGSDATRALWPFPFALELRVTVGSALSVELVVSNPGQETMTFTSALHSYFTVSDISDIAIYGMEQCAYLDKLDQMRQKIQRGAITFQGEVDRMYLEAEAECTISDPGLQRRICITKTGSRSNVVWNPWIDKSKQMPDFGDDEYHGMVCVETANVATDEIAILPGGQHTLGVQIRVEPLTGHCG